MGTGNLFAIVLAAGSASRFGATKQLATIDGETLVSRAVRLAENVCGQSVVLVTGNDRTRVAAACAPLAGFFTVNTDYSSGLSSSIRAGIEAVNPTAYAALLLLADQPQIGIDDLMALCATWHRRPDAIVASAYAGTVGPPAIFPRALFPALSALDGDRGAKAVIEAHRENVELVECAAAAVDIDRPQDLEELRN
jgi:CTP:molybdopterin cytidylyltransferase MocA